MAEPIKSWKPGQPIKGDHHVLSNRLGYDGVMDEWYVGGESSHMLASRFGNMKIKSPTAQRPSSNGCSPKAAPVSRGRSPTPRRSKVNWCSLMTQTMRMNGKRRVSPSRRSPRSNSPLIGRVTSTISARSLPDIKRTPAACSSQTVKVKGEKRKDEHLKYVFHPVA